MSVVSNSFSLYRTGVNRLTVDEKTAQRDKPGEDSEEVVDEKQYVEERREGGREGGRGKEGGREGGREGEREKNCCGEYLM